MVRVKVRDWKGWRPALATLARERTWELQGKRNWHEWNSARGLKVAAQ